MQIGSGKGKNKIYKKDGSPKLKGGEKIIIDFYEKCSVIFRKKGHKLFEVVLEGGKGNIYLTNRRFIYIRPPLAWYKRSTHKGFIMLTLFDSVANYEDTKEMKSKNIFEFIEFEFKEDFKLEYSFLGGASINLTTKLGEFQINTKKYVVEEIEKIHGERNEIE